MNLKLKNELNQMINEIHSNKQEMQQVDTLSLNQLNFSSLGLIVSDE